MLALRMWDHLAVFDDSGGVASGRAERVSVIAKKSKTKGLQSPKQAKHSLVTAWGRLVDCHFRVGLITDCPCRPAVMARQPLLRATAKRHNNCQ